MFIGLSNSVSLPASRKPNPLAHSRAGTTPAQTGFDQVQFSGNSEHSDKSSPSLWKRLCYFVLAPFRWFKNLWQGNELRPGSPAPDFTLKDHAGRPVKLQGALKQGPVVLFFYPKNNTAFCTKQVKAFRDAYPEFRKLGASVFGISSDSEKSHQQFNAEQRLPFALLSDPGGKVREQYGARSFWGLVPSRATFVIDKTGKIQTVYSSQAKIGTHISRALQCLKQGDPREK